WLHIGVRYLMPFLICSSLREKVLQEQRHLSGRQIQRRRHQMRVSDLLQEELRARLRLVTCQPLPNLGGLFRFHSSSFPPPPGSNDETFTNECELRLKSC